MNIYKTNDKLLLENCLRHFAFRNEYDVMTNEIVHYIFDKIKNNYIGELSEGNVWAEIIHGNLDNPTPLSLNPRIPRIYSWGVCQIQI